MKLAADRIAAEARKIRFWHTVLTALTAVLFAVGWCLAQVFAVLWLAVVWCFAAVKAGWQQAMTPKPPQPTEAQLLKDNQTLREEVLALANIIRARDAL